VDGTAASMMTVILARKKVVMAENGGG